LAVETTTDDADGDEVVDAPLLPPVAMVDIKA